MYHYFQGMLSIWHQEQKIFLSDLILIAILVNNAFKTVQQRVKGKEDICRRADAQQRYLTQDFTLWWTGLRCVILEDRYNMYNINIRISDVFIIIIFYLTFFTSFALFHFFHPFFYPLLYVSRQFFMTVVESFSTHSF